MSVATEFPPAVFVPARARSGSRAAGSRAAGSRAASPEVPASGPRLKLVPPADGCPPATRRRLDGARRAGRVRRPTACRASSAQLQLAGLPTEADGAAQPEAQPVRLTRRGVVVSALGVALAGGLLLLVAHLSAGSPAPRPATVAPGAVVTVQPGDTLWSIAGQVAPRRDPRRVVEQIRRANHLDSASIMPGQTLKVG